MIWLLPHPSSTVHEDRLPTDCESDQNFYIYITVIFRLFGDLTVNLVCGLWILQHLYACTNAALYPPFNVWKLLKHILLLALLKIQTLGIC